MRFCGFLPHKKHDNAFFHFLLRNFSIKPISLLPFIINFILIPINIIMILEFMWDNDFYQLSLIIELEFQIRKLWVKSGSIILNWNIFDLKMQYINRTFWFSNFRNSYVRFRFWCLRIYLFIIKDRVQIEYSFLSSV